MCASGTRPSKYSLAVSSFSWDRLTSIHLPPFSMAAKAEALPMPELPPTTITFGGGPEEEDMTCAMLAANVMRCISIEQSIRMMDELN